ncbi:hypothetical protein [Halobacillus sp. BBL2006]|uniref:hypothetical protein n=1 Tax=Halobacillus sp. BBL2006 TaxID=1543706 RepID=UPI000543C51C|nr:hypothetical protein [Halobacillus sp. BBL2006]KHE67541.1 hypothetical protein LD39_17000 [Halobacillus sp. BBL2006]
MSELTVEQHHMLHEYNQLLHTVSEAFEYLEQNIEEEAPTEAQQVFEDLLLAFEQLSVSHEQMTVLFEEEVEMATLIAGFAEIVDSLKDWFVLETNAQKRELLAEKVVPSYEGWKDQVQLFVKPYIAH